MQRPRRHADPERPGAGVGSSIYLRGDRRWVVVEDYWAHVAPDWRGALGADVLAVRRDIPHLHPQEPAKQAPFKGSFSPAAATAG